MHCTELVHEVCHGSKRRLGHEKEQAVTEFNNCKADRLLKASRLGENWRNQQHNFPCQENGRQINPLQFKCLVQCSQSGRICRREPQPLRKFDVPMLRSVFPHVAWSKKYLSYARGATMQQHRQDNRKSKTKEEDNDQAEENGQRVVSVDRAPASWEETLKIWVTAKDHQACLEHGHVEGIAQEHCNGHEKKRAVGAERATERQKVSSKETQPIRTHMFLTQREVAFGRSRFHLSGSRFAQSAHIHIPFRSTAQLAVNGKTACRSLIKSVQTSRCCIHCT